MYENTIKDNYSESILVCQHKQGELLAFLYRTENKLMLGMLFKTFSQTKEGKFTKENKILMLYRYVEYIEEHFLV